MEQGCLAAIADEAAALIRDKEYGKAENLFSGIDVQRLTREEEQAVLGWILALPPAFVAQSVSLCFSLVMLYILQGDFAAAAKWQAALVAMREHHREDSRPRRILENRIACCALAMPVGQNSNILFSLAVLSHEYGDGKIPLARLSATDKFPSVLRGAKDFSTLGRHYRASASMLKPLLPTVLNFGAFGVCEVAIAEILYERGDMNGAALQATVAIGAEDPETAFAALAIMAKVAVADPVGRPAEEFLRHIGTMLARCQAHWLQANYQALLARHAMLAGDGEAVRAWMDACRLDDLERIRCEDLYAMMTKARAYISLGEYRQAAMLLESLALLNQQWDRPLDRAECLVNGAIVCEQLGNSQLAMDKLEQALLLAQEYSYIRVIADCGRPVFQLLGKYAKGGHSEELTDKYLKKVLDASAAFATLHPALYGKAGGGRPARGGKAAEPAAGQPAEGDVAFTNSELHVLQLLDSGFSNKNIAGELSVSASTVKFHISNIMGKLQAANRVEAIKRARDLGFLA